MFDGRSPAGALVRQTPSVAECSGVPLPTRDQVFEQKRLRIEAVVAMLRAVRRSSGCD